MPPTNSFPWGPALVGGAAIFTLLTAALTPEPESESKPNTPHPLEYEWFPAPQASLKHNDATITEVHQKARTTYPSIPSKHLAISTKRVQKSNTLSKEDPWVAAVFHTGWEPRLILSSQQENTRKTALEALDKMLDDKKLAEYEWAEWPSTSNTAVISGSENTELVHGIKRLACIIHACYTPADFAVALRRQSTHSKRDFWVAGLWALPHEGFVEEFMWVGQGGECHGRTREEALQKLKLRLQKQKP